MAFHSKGGSISRSTRTNRRDKESILGLSGWLFADLLLAIAVIFLVVQDKPSVDPGEVTAKNVADLKAQVLYLEEKVLNLEETLAEFDLPTPPAEESGLIANPDEILTISIPNGATAKSDVAFTDRLLRSKLMLGTETTSFVNLKAADYKIGFVIWFARSSTISKETSARHLGTFVNFMNNKDLVGSQFKEDSPGDFPNLSGYNYGGIKNDLFLRVFLFR